MERFICIHGHFYQPPRENPWIEAIEVQDTAYPYHDWNERITAECYAPNARSRILDGEDRIIQIVNNYSKISFNFGPTLLNWLEAKAPSTYRAIIEADRKSRVRFSNHGSAIAQAYNHIILPLANRRDKRTQVIWGIRDFEHRFGRAPEGMWLPETAVDLESLDIMAKLGIAFTILAPSQASRVRPLDTRNWRSVSGARIDPSMAYELRLPSRRKINLFFYDGPISRSVAFEKLLASGEDFAHRLLGAFSDSRTWPQLAHIATDGETYGHHHKYGEMALSYALRYIETNDLARLTNYGEFLERNPPTHRVEIFEDTSWSCAHGIERWRSDCGCNAGRAGWNQKWRGPLLDALQWLRDTLAPRYENKARLYLKDPWAARDDYISVILDRSPENVDRFFDRHAILQLSDDEKITALKLLELQRYAMLMFTSCGWFFDDVSGIETAQVIQYAGRVVQLAQELFGDGIEARFLDLIERAKSNDPEHGDGRQIYEEFVTLARVDLPKVGAHYAVSSVFNGYQKRASVHCYRADREDYHGFESGRAKLVVGRARITSEITRESALLSFGVIHFGDHNLSGGVREYQGQQSYDEMCREMTDAFKRADFPEIIRFLDRHFKAATYSLKSLFRDEQRKILNQVMASSLADAEAAHRQTYERFTPLMRFITGMNVSLDNLSAPLPKAFYAAAEFILNIDMGRAFADDNPDIERVRSLLEEARTWRIALDTEGLEYRLRRSIERVAFAFLANPSDANLLLAFANIADVARPLPFQVNFWTAQNVFYDVLQSAYDDFRDRAAQGDASASEWAARFKTLGQKLKVRVD